MEQLVTSNLKLGIIAGGQLGKMLIQEASKWDIKTYVLDEDEDCPAGNIASFFVKGNYKDFDSVYRFGKMVDILTFEIENVNIEALKKLKAEGIKISPDPDIIEMIQDKGLQKQLFINNNIPTAPFNLFENSFEIRKACGEKRLNFPFVQKVRKGGYDGRGVAIINSESELNKLLEGPSIVESKVDVGKEVSVIAARNANGNIKCYSVVEMIFDPNVNLVDKLICPSNISKELSDQAIQIATNITELLGIVGLLAVEFFIDTSGKLIVNEMAPRPHNSGHHTIESMITSQFEQHLRAILNLPLGSTRLKMPSVMLNIIGEDGFEGAVKYEGLTESMAIEGVKIHLYGKRTTRPFRKMGHITILSDSVEDALKKSDRVKHILKVKS